MSCLNCTLGCWCMIGTSSDLPWRSSEIFGNFRKMFVWPWDTLGECEVYMK